MAQQAQGSRAVRLLSTAQVAERWGCSTKWLSNMRSAGRGPAYVKLGAAVRYRVDDLEEHESRSRVEAIA